MDRRALSERLWNRLGDEIFDLPLERIPACPLWVYKALLLPGPSQQAIDDLIMGLRVVRMLAAADSVVRVEAS